MIKIGLISYLKTRKEKKRREKEKRRKEFWESVVTSSSFPSWYDEIFQVKLKEKKEYEDNLVRNIDIYTYGIEKISLDVAPLEFLDKAADFGRYQFLDRNKKLITLTFDTLEDFCEKIRPYYAVEFKDNVIEVYEGLGKIFEYEYDIINDEKYIALKNDKELLVNEIIDMWLSEIIKEEYCPDLRSFVGGYLENIVYEFPEEIKPEIAIEYGLITLKDASTNKNYFCSETLYVKEDAELKIAKYLYKAKELQPTTLY